MSLQFRCLCLSTYNCGPGHACVKDEHSLINNRYDSNVFADMLEKAHLIGSREENHQGKTDTTITVFSAHGLMASEVQPTT